MANRKKEVYKSKPMTERVTLSMGYLRSTTLRQQRTSRMPWKTFSTFRLLMTRSYSCTPRGCMITGTPYPRSLSFPKMSGRHFDTINAIESLNFSYRRLNRQRSVFPSSQGLLKALYMATFEIVKKWTVPIQNWGKAGSHVPGEDAGITKNTGISRVNIRPDNPGAFDMSAYFWYVLIKGLTAGTAAKSYL